MKPVCAWEAARIGDCCPPLETERGWLVLLHGLGAVGRQSVGAMLLDLNDPTKIIGRLREPLIAPGEAAGASRASARVNSCGAVLQGRELIIPYSVSDYAPLFATVSLDAVLDAMRG